MMRSWPAKALTSISSVLFGRWKLVSSRSTTRNAKPGVMKMSVSPLPARAALAAAAQRPTRARARLVVPTATTRPPRARARAIAAAWPRRRPRTTRCACACSARFSLRTGWKVPAPTCSVTLARSTPRAASAASSAVVEVQRRGRRGDRARVARRTRSGSARRRRPSSACVDVGRQRHVAVALEQGERIAGKAQAEQRRRRRRPRPEHLGVERVGEADARCPACGDLLARRWATHVVARPQHALDQRLDRAAARPCRRTGAP